MVRPSSLPAVPCGLAPAARYGLARGARHGLASAVPCGLAPAAPCARARVALGVLAVAALGALAPAAALAQKAPPAAQKPAPAESSLSPETEVEIRTLEERVAELKEKVHRTKARLQGLQELAVGGDVSAGAKAVVVHRNEMGASFVLESASFAIDGAPVWVRADAGGDLDRRDEIPVFEGRLAPGSHQLALRLGYRGKAADAPRYQVQSAYTFVAEAGKLTRIQVVGFERAGGEAKDRPAVRYDLQVRREETVRSEAVRPETVRPGRGSEGAAR